MRLRACRNPSILVLGLLMLCGACSLVGSESSDGDEGADTSTVTLVTHDSFTLPKRLIADFERTSGYRLDLQQSGDAGELTNKLVLSRDQPIGDVAFGVDNTFAGRAVAEGVFADSGATLPAGAEAYRLEGADQLAPVDTGNVCVNVDLAWYAAHGQRPPASFDDLLDPAYRDQFVAEGAPTSSPGFAFLLATIAAHGGADSDEWQRYWRDLMANGTKLTKGWEDAYYVDFTGGGGEQSTRPIVVSYDSSPAFTVDDQTGRSTTRALLDTCFRQTEYAGAIAGSDNPAGARAVIEWLLSAPVQRALPTSMYVFPVRSGVRLPKTWARFATPATDPWQIDPADIEANRRDWLTDWTDVTTGSSGG